MIVPASGVLARRTELSWSMQEGLRSVWVLSTHSKTFCNPQRVCTSGCQAFNDNGLTLGAVTPVEGLQA